MATPKAAEPRTRIADPLAEHRDRLMLAIALVGIPILVPFAINNFLQGRVLLGAALLLVLLTLGLDALAIHRRRQPPLPYPLLLLPMAAGIAISLGTQGVYGALWTYPTVVFGFFVLSRRVANLCALALLAVAGPLALRYVGVGVAIRFVASLILTIVIVNVTLAVIDDLQRRLVEQAGTDPLTGALNRRQVAPRLAETIERGRRHGEAASLLLIDVDHFKSINDELGHDAGDEVLRGVVTTIARRARQFDPLFRMGGEEFLLLAPAARESDAVMLGEALRKAIAAASMVGGRTVTVSIGVSALRAEDSIDAWLKRADGALYAAKRAGRDRVVAAG